MSFTQSFSPMYYICDNSHKYIVSTLDGVNSNYGKLSVRLKPIEDVYQLEPKYHYWRTTQDIEELHDVLEILKTVSGKPYKYHIESDKKIELTIDKFELITVVPNIVCTVQPDELVDSLYKESFAKKLNKKRCRLNNLIKKLDINKLSDNHLAKLENILD